MTAKKLLLRQNLPLLAKLPAEKEQMLFSRLDVQNDKVLSACWSGPNLKEFASLVSTDIETNALRIFWSTAHSAAANRRKSFQNLHPRAHLGKVTIQITAHCFFPF